MLGAISRYSTGHDLAPLRCKIPEGSGVFIVYQEAAISTEPAYFSSVISPSWFAVVFGPAALIGPIRHFYPLLLSLNPPVSLPLQ